MTRARTEAVHMLRGNFLTGFFFFLIVLKYSEDYRGSVVL